MSFLVFFENQRSSPAADLTANYVDTFDARHLHFDDPAPWSNSLGDEILELSAEVRTQFYSSSQWMYKADFDADDGAQVGEKAQEQPSPATRVRFRVWTKKPVELQGTQPRNKNSTQYAFNRASIGIGECTP